MSAHGKRYAEDLAKVDREREHAPAEAVPLVSSLPTAKFDESIEVHVRTGLNVRHADEQLRGTIALPNGLGKDVTVAVFAQGAKAPRPRRPAPTWSGADDLAKRIQDGFTDFDIAIATPDLMTVVGQLGRILGPAGKMPNPKVGTVTMDVAKAVEESKSGKVEYRTDRTAIVHLVIGKTSFARSAAAELRGRRRRAHPRQAVGGQGSLPALDHDDLDDGSRRQGRSESHARPPRAGRAPRPPRPAEPPETPGTACRSAGRPG